MPNLLKQPLLHFLLLGALIFLAYGLATGPTDEEPAFDDKRIVVNRQALLDFMQYRASNFDPELYRQRLDAMSAEEVSALVGEYVREEALYREALALGLAEGDYIIRQRLVQRVEFLLENLATMQPPSDEELQAFFAENQDAYRSQPVYTFAHIFFDAQRNGGDDAMARAQAMLARSAGTGFEQAGEHGDRYPFLQTYEERTRDFVSSNFSAEFVDSLDALTPGESWQGPLASRYGYHLVMLRSRTESSMPGFAEVRERVLDDYRYEDLLRSRQEAEDKVIAEYAVEVNLQSDASEAR